MNRSSLFLAFSMALAVTGTGLPASLQAASLEPATVSAKSNDTRSVWLVEFAEPPLATFRGNDPRVSPKLRTLAATSPAVTGADRLDVNSPASKSYRAELAKLREDRLARASYVLGRSIEPLFVYDVVNNGVALELTAAEAKQLAAQDGIAHVEPDFVRKPLTDAGPQWIKADSMWSAPGGGFRGEGRIVGVIDTGINAKHSSFAGVSGRYSFVNPRSGFLGLCASNPNAGCNNKLIGIYDHTTGDEDAEANDGSDKEGHGSHVASTAAGNPLTLNGGIRISGVAPRANVIMYKACEEEASCRGSWLLSAINQAVADRVDVINYSIGGGAVDPWGYQDSMAMLAAFEAGVVVVAAAGNDGPAPGSLSSPSNSPWVISAANNTHDRAQVAKLTLSGGNTPRPGNSVLMGSSATTTAYGPAPIVYAGNFNSPLCATGPNVNAMPPDTSTSPWVHSVFTGQIVVCDRGTYARVIKGLNVKNAGGGGMVLVNSPAEGASTVADEHELPATHLSYADGAALKQWLTEGSGHQATIGASETGYVAAFGDVLNASSGRGPIDGDWLKPNVGAPGTNILAAYKDGSGSSSSFAYMTGTSMATPHIAGAVALLRQAHPDWGPAEVMSVLQGTARASIRMPDGATPAGLWDAGAGEVDLSKANNPGLVFPVTGAQFRAAKPSTGGKPRDLNLGALVDGHCVDSCSFTRTVKNISGQGDWGATVELDEGALTVSPTSFSLASGASQSLTFTYTPSVDGGYGRWINGRVYLKRVGASTSDIQIPVLIKPSAGNVPDVIQLSSAGANVASESGWANVDFSGLVALPSAQFSGTDLVEPLYEEPNIAEDSTRDEVYDNLSASMEGNTIFRMQASQTGRVRLRVEAKSQTARDIDLYVGNASTNTSLPSEETQMCSSHQPVPDEVCDLELDVVAGQNFWILVQNWQQSSSAPDLTQLSYAVVTMDEGNMTVTGPNAPAATPFDIDVNWDE
ncbi:MAG: S8 family serine peptidase, partial [Xanthomonadales bacterium]|nr:S8 family serine peptidase [Xanthomonadales bacterium]